LSSFSSFRTVPRAQIAGTNRGDQNDDSSCSNTIRPEAASKQPSVPKETIKGAVADGKTLIRDGKTKVEAAMAIYAKLKGADR
jgi:hypothetical protein